jgi:hypothetical protein
LSDRAVLHLLNHNTEQVWRDDLVTVPQMKREAVEAQDKDPHGSFLLMESLRDIAQQTTQTLMLRLATSERPLAIWALHVELENRGVPPCLRPSTSEQTRQHLFLATLADLCWIAKRHPHHQALHRRLQGVFRHDPRSDAWHKTALWAYRQCRGIPHMLAKRLGLTDAQRCHTSTMPTRQQSADRRMLRSRLTEMKEVMRHHATQHPDKAGKVTPDAIAERRAELINVHVRLGRVQSDTIDYMGRVAGRPISRQTLVRQLRSAAVVADAERLIFGHL